MIKEKSKNAARSRRKEENQEFLELAKLLPLPAAIITQMDKASILRLVSSYIKFRQMFSEELIDELDLDNPVKNTIKELGEHILQALDGFVFILALDPAKLKAKIVYISHGASVHLGLSQLDLIGNSIFEYIHPEDHSLMYDVLELVKSLNLRKDYKQEVVFPLRMKCILAKRNAGLVTQGYKVIHCSGYLKCILEKIFIGSKYEHSVESVCLMVIGHSNPLPTGYLSNIKMHSNMFMFRASQNLKLMFLDPRVTQLTGYDPSDLAEKTLYHYVHLSDSLQLEDSHRVLVHKGQVTTKYYRFLTKTGGWVWIQSYMIIVKNSRSSRPHCIVSANYVLTAIEKPGLIMAYEQQSSCSNPGSPSSAPVSTPVTIGDLDNHRLSPSYSDRTKKTLDIDYADSPSSGYLTNSTNHNHYLPPSPYTPQSINGSTYEDNVYYSPDLLYQYSDLDQDPLNTLQHEQDTHHPFTPQTIQQHSPQNQQTQQQHQHLLHQSVISLTTLEQQHNPSSGQQKRPYSTPSSFCDSTNDFNVLLTNSVPPPEYYHHHLVQSDSTSSTTLNVNDALLLKSQQETHDLHLSTPLTNQQHSPQNNQQTQHHLQHLLHQSVTSPTTLEQQQHSPPSGQQKRFYSTPTSFCDSTNDFNVPLTNSVPPPEYYSSHHYHHMPSDSTSSSMLNVDDALLLKSQQDTHDLHPSTPLTNQQHSSQNNRQTQQHPQHLLHQSVTSPMTLKQQQHSPQSSQRKRPYSTSSSSCDSSNDFNMLLTISVPPPGYYSSHYYHHMPSDSTSSTTLDKADDVITYPICDFNNNVSYSATAFQHHDGYQQCHPQVHHSNGNGTVKHPHHHHLEASSASYTSVIVPSSTVPASFPRSCKRIRRRR